MKKHLIYGYFFKRIPATNFVDTDNGKIVGMILCGHDGRRGYIYHTVVEGSYRNQEIATQLIESAISALQHEGITRVCLSVMETNDYGKSFWIKYSQSLDTQAGPSWSHADILIKFTLFAMSASLTVSKMCYNFSSERFTCLCSTLRFHPILYIAAVTADIFNQC